MPPAIDSSQKPLADENDLDSSLQLINEDKAFNSQVFDYFQDINIHNCGLNYHVVSVFGSQSTGKSTLLNALFGTSFDVMNEIQRRQTTKGIWMACAQNTPQLLKSSFNEDSISSSNNSIFSSTNSQANILVLDVEGTDGRERGEDQDFERKSALFALATSEVLIVNMWENQVGLYQGANMGLLKTVFEVNLSLFQAGTTKPSRSLILFVIRDHIGTTPLSNLQATVIADLSRIWDALSKPPAAQDSSLHDFFDLQFFTLPHKILMPEQFAAQTSQLAQYFTQPTSSSYVFKPEYHRGVPIDGWPIYSEQIWEQIEENKDLDLPTQQILVARFRCEEIATQAWQTFETGLHEAQKTCNNALGGPLIVADFNALVTTIRSGTLDIYDSLASRYSKAVYRAKREDLLTKVDTRLINLYKAQLLALHKSAITTFNDVIAEAAKQEPGPSAVPFYKVLEQARSNALTFFVNGAIQSSVDPHVFTHDEELGYLEAELATAATAAKTTEMKKISQRVLKKIKLSFYNDLETYFEAPEEDTWDKVLVFFNNTVMFALSSATTMPTAANGLTETTQGTPDFGVGATQEENEKGVRNIRSAAWIALDSRLKDITRDDNVLMKLRERFEDLFRYDSEGVPVVWKAGDNIETPYIKARDDALNILPIFASATCKSGRAVVPDVDLAQYYAENSEQSDAASDDLEVDNSTFSVRIPPSRQQDITKRFKKQAEASYVEAKRSTTQVFSQIPGWFYVILVLLGWNELMAVLRNPLLFVFCILAASGGYFTYTLNLWGPMLSVSGAMLEKTTEIGKQKLRDFLEVPEELKNANVRQRKQRVRTSPISSSSSSSSSSQKDIPLEDMSHLRTAQ